MVTGQSTVLFSVSLLAFCSRCWSWSRWKVFFNSLAGPAPFHPQWSRQEGGGRRPAASNGLLWFELPWLESVEAQQIRWCRLEPAEVRVCGLTILILSTVEQTGRRRPAASGLRWRRSMRRRTRPPLLLRPPKPPRPPRPLRGQLSPLTAIKSTLLPKGSTLLGRQSCRCMWLLTPPLKTRVCTHLRLLRVWSGFREGTKTRLWVLRCRYGSSWLLLEIGLTPYFRSYSTPQLLMFARPTFAFGPPLVSSPPPPAFLQYFQHPPSTSNLLWYDIFSPERLWPQIFADSRSSLFPALCWMQFTRASNAVSSWSQLRTSCCWLSVSDGHWYHPGCCLTLESLKLIYVVT